MALFVRLILLCISCLHCNLYAEDDIADTQQQLDKLAEIVSEIDAKLQNNVKSHTVVQKEMAQLEREMGKLHQQIDTSKQRISASRQVLGQLEAQRKLLDQQIHDQREQVKQQIRLAYSSGTQSQWKALLSQNSFQHIGRNAVIYDLIHQARRTQIEHMQRLGRQLQENQHAQQQEQSQLQKLLKKQTNAQSGLNKVRDEKQAIQARLATQIASGNSQLKQQRNKQQQLKKLLKKLTIKSTKGKFPQQKGKLHWPIEGKLKHRFGESRQSSAGIQWTGVLISAKRGAQIKAIYPGEVVFSDWFDHYGWLLIVDHGDGYMSLYAHAEGLYRSVGDEVLKGEVIAVAGDSGDIVGAGLYFEIRRQGSPVDPARWCVHPKMAYSR